MQLFISVDAATPHSRSLSAHLLVLLVHSSIVCSRSSWCGCREEPRQSALFATQDPCGRISSLRLLGRGEGSAPCGRWPLTHTHSTRRVTNAGRKTDIQLCSNIARGRMEKSLWSERAALLSKRSMDGAAETKWLQFINPKDYIIYSSWFGIDAGTEGGQACWVTFGRVEATAGRSWRSQHVFVFPHLWETACPAGWRSVHL